MGCMRCGKVGGSASFDDGTENDVKDGSEQQTKDTTIAPPPPIYGPWDASSIKCIILRPPSKTATNSQCSKDQKAEVSFPK